MAFKPPVLHVTGMRVKYVGCRSSSANCDNDDDKATNKPQINTSQPVDLDSLMVREAISDGLRNIFKCYSFLLDWETIA